MAFTAAEEQEIRDLQAKLDRSKVAVWASYAAFNKGRTRRDERRERREKDNLREKAEAVMLDDLKSQGVQVYETASGMTAILIALRLLAPILRPIVEAAIKRLLDNIFNPPQAQQGGVE